MSSSKRGLTIRSSRDRFAAAELFCKLSQRRGRKALRLNSGVRVIRVFYCFGIVRNGKSRKQYLCALQGCFVPQGALMLVVLI